MKLLLKFSAIFTLVFGIGLAAAGYLSYRLLQESARDQVLQQARLMMEAMRSARDYTTNQVKPLLTPLQLHQRAFLPQTVPAYAATENFTYIRSRYPDYAYKEAALNPTNPRDRAVDWEADVISMLRNHPDKPEVVGERAAATGQSLFLARPIKATQACLDCHDLPKAAPVAMVRRYGAANGFGWKKDEIIGAQIVSVPMSLPLQMADRAFRTFFISLISVFLVTLLVLNVVMYFTVARPVARLSSMADRISLGDLDVPELPVRGHDEVSVLASSFNRMRRSLVAAMKLLNET
jgi:HAMP domain-containing protein